MATGIHIVQEEKEMSTADMHHHPSFSQRPQGDISVHEMNLMKHSAHTTLTDMPFIPSKFRFNARQSVITRGRSNTGASSGSFTPRVTTGGTAIKAMEASSTHYTPDWFKISIKTVDRDNVMAADEETKLVTSKIQEICALRDKWVYKPQNSDHVGAVLSDGQICIDVSKMQDKLPPSIADKYTYHFEKGIMRITSENSGLEVFEEKAFDEYMADLQKVMDLVSDGPAKTMCYRRLKILQSRYTIHNWLNDNVEVLEVKSVPHRDFYNVRKVDNHIHHSACMHQKHLLRFIKRKLEEEPDTICFKT
eukprot:CAMPEP_0197054918 /NCGR_PEP_ID=MMETSP1384-20130603/53193_1 /TAXON_ID=29189 /ORGANISM="Ammonia sp." /LENGTH=305 /DNA_ID=CAMNT_0042488283 /DNA_START=41 /DNA_END=954 /DNA_ORIENTATION=-